MILAAGRGERMRPLTDTLPKPLIKVSGRSLLDCALDRLVQHGIEQVVVNAHYLGDQIAAHLTQRDRPATQLMREDQLLETGGSVKNALALFGDEPFFVINGDGLWLDGEVPMLRRLEAVWHPERMDALLLLQPLEETIGREKADRGDYFLGGDGRARHRASAAAAPYLFASVSVCDKRLFADAPDGPFSLLRLWNRAETAGRLAGLAHDGPWFHIGTVAALAEAERWLETHT
jgi:N-acetyl-alpha-D-muramate 1-phosphate uridylyltransferase